MPRLAVFVSACFYLCAASTSIAQISVQGASTQQRSTTAGSQLSIDDVVKMSKAGLTDDIIVQQVRKAGHSFDLSPDQLIQLKNSGVSDLVIRAMVNPTTATVVSVATAGASISDLPVDIGIYVKRQNKWVEVLPEIVNWKTGGVLKNTATLGIVKGDLNGHLEHAHSSLTLGQPIDLLIVAPEGVAMTEYQLLRLRENGNNREFRTVTGGVFHVSGGDTRDLLEFTWSKIANRTYSLSLPNLRPGEYGVLPSDSFSARNAAGSRGKLYSFRVAE